MMYPDKYALMMLEMIKGGTEQKQAQINTLYNIIDDIDDDTWDHIKAGEDEKELNDDYHVHFRHLVVKSYWNKISEMISKEKMELTELLGVEINFDLSLVSKFLPDDRLKYEFHEDEGHHLNPQWRILKEELCSCVTE